MAYRETARTLAKKQAVRQRLLESAESLVASGGFRGAAVAKVADLADVATGTVYRHFASKGDLFSEVFQRATAREVARVDEALHESGSAMARLERALRVFASRALRAPTMAWALIAEPVDPQVDQERLIYRQTYARLFAETLDEGVRTGEIPALDTQLASAAIVGAIAEALIGPLSPTVQAPQAPEPESHAGLVDAILAFCLQAVCVQREPSAVRPPIRSLT
ncbi:MAG: TetR family transcriptional regulator [Alteromonadaceae bacterium]|nr:TetR family transcriptional regulator [Alteromonadaceae bacterium]|tara:strand:- start:4753 stop:5418 length:666 start_codon:yes stop_codon:yes gene_type:complete